MCVEMKYLDGLMINPSGGAVCDGWGGENYCGPKSSRIHYMAMKCDTNKYSDVMDCYRELAEGCAHTDDLIISCTNIDFNKPIEP